MFDRKTPLAAVFLLSIFASSEVISDIQTKNLVQQSASVVKSDDVKSAHDSAKRWGLNSQEWAKYETIMQGPRGVWSKDLDPLTALGIEAESEIERNRYAELLVEATRKRIMSEIAFQKAYDAAHARLYPDQLAVVPFLMKEKKHSANSMLDRIADTAGKQQRRIAFFTLIDNCSKCNVELERLISINQKMDIYLVDSDAKDEKIRRWAKAMKIPLDRVADRQITLNHNKFPSVTKNTQLPASVSIN